MPANKSFPPDGSRSPSPREAPLPAPTRRQRVLFGVALAAMILWLAALGFLATL